MVHAVCAARRPGSCRLQQPQTQDESESVPRQGASAGVEPDYELVSGGGVGGVKERMSR